MLVVCDYMVHYPEALPLHSIDAKHVAEQLITVFPRVGVPHEILRDQGSNFTSASCRALQVSTYPCHLHKHVPSTD